MDRALIATFVLVFLPVTTQAQEVTAVVTNNAPIYLIADANRPPLRVAAAGTVLVVKAEEGDWLKVEFKDPQYGLRTGYVEVRLVRIMRPELQPMDLSAREASRPPAGDSALPGAPVPTNTPTQPSDAKKDDFTRTYDAPIAQVYAAAAQVAALKWNVTHTDKDARIISFKTGMNMRTWKGFDMTAVCIDLGDGRTQVSVHPQRRGESEQLFSWKEGNRIASTFHQELAKRLSR